MRLGGNTGMPFKVGSRERGGCASAPPGPAVAPSSLGSTPSRECRGPSPGF